MESVPTRRLEIETTTPAAQPVPVKVRETRLEDLPDLDYDGDDGFAHFVRTGHRHAICGVEIDPSTLEAAAGAIDCPACRGILKTFLEGKGWEGFGKRRPSKQHRKEFEDLLGK
jgi:hypothetical protein